MGMTDFEVAENYCSVVSDLLNELHIGAKVAWLGQKHPSINEGKFLYTSIMSGVHTQLEHHYYDLNHEDSDESTKWDVHDEWDISGYDLVLGLRVLYLCDSRKKLLRNLIKLCKSNDKVVFDFMTGNPVLVNGKETFVKKNNSPTILPFFPELYDAQFSVQSNHDDQVVAIHHLKEVGLQIDNILTFRDGVKNRYYTLCEVFCDS